MCVAATCKRRRKQARQTSKAKKFATRGKIEKRKGK
jgi:hypothetical protein